MFLESKNRLTLTDELIYIIPLFRSTFVRRVDNKFHGGNKLLTPTQIHALAIIIMSDGITMSQLGSELGVVKQHLTTIIAALTKRCFVVKTLSPGNYKSFTLLPTDLGKMHFDNIRKYITSQLINILSVLSDNEVDDFLRSLLAFRRSVEKLREKTQNSANP